MPLYKTTSDMFSKISLIYTNNPHTAIKVNLSQDEIKALRELKQMKDVVIKSADKGGPILKNTGTYNKRTITTKPLAETTHSCSETKQEFA